MIRKLTMGKSYDFAWAPPTADYLVSTAQLSIHWAAGTQTYTLTARTGDTVTAISADRRRITVEWGVDGALASLVGGQPQPAWLSFAGRAQIPVRVVRVVSLDTSPPEGGVLELAEPLPVNADAGGALEWLTMTTQVSSAHLPSTMTRAIRWSVLYTPVRFGVTGNDVVDHGTLAVVRAPFATGLTDAYLAGVAPWTANARPPGQTTWTPQIEAGLDRLCGMVVPELPTDRWEDHLTGGPWLRAHALATLLGIMEGQQAAGQDRSAAIERADLELAAEVKRRLARLEWLDDGDGTVESGETGLLAGGVEARCHVGDSSVVDLSDDVNTPDVVWRPRFGEAR